MTGCKCGSFLEKLLVAKTWPTRVCRDYLHMPNLPVLGTHLLGRISGFRWLMHCLGTAPELARLESEVGAAGQKQQLNLIELIFAVAEESILEKIDIDPVDGESLPAQTRYFTWMCCCSESQLCWHNLLWNIFQIIMYFLHIVRTEKLEWKGRVWKDWETKSVKLELRW